ncbi:DNA mismatch repair endonuclease MutL [Cytobacillus sp. S13-E01]|uniref:DNA mismatch repair endonuclease MutL n=1 Tax=Cytobacillus sp. S13-E01 TaxID=3031326 RepID=UPI0023D839CB|nr:DNA mismatch repair endonuclease MutL [Cytobacillus sp. S13-E01]MDF0725100.1 DNA mismatch repair endonuclease MutL [Cytobacillus sp. S13-E01]
MGKIIKLNDQLSNKIAAGEVVERPASVVKELVENAIDANSTIIEVEVEEAGLAKIRIIDNGDGIEEDDCLNAFHRHATSKIKDENDLFRIRTLGFRGEALPSIASVSELDMKTSTGESSGTQLILKGGEIIKHVRTNSRKGTDLTISNLFFNTPARLKYMKTIHTELGNITDIINRIAMAHPSISFRLSHNGKRMLYTTGNGDVLQVIAAIYGFSIAKKMIPLDLQSLDFKVNGYVSLPEVTRASRNYMSTIINGRFIKNYSLSKAVQQGYHTLLPIGRYPIAFLEIQMDPLIVDVNVHPAKLEVRISKEVELNELIETGIKAVFKQKQLIPDVAPKKKASAVLEQQRFTFEHQNRQTEMVVAPSNLNAFVIREEESLEPEVEEAEIFKYTTVATHNKPIEDLKLPTEPIMEEERLETDIQKIDSGMNIEDRIPPLYPIGQMHGTYILAQNDDGLYIIDQHAAQERIKYEYFREKVGQVISEVQELLVPITLEYSTNESILISENIEELAKVGIFLEVFGHNSFIVRSHPQWFPAGEEVLIIEEMIEQVLILKKVDIKKLREEAAIMMSCKASIKANHYLKNEEIFALLEALRKTSDPFTCPHGRPIIIHYSTYEMEKMFKRVM